MASGTSWNRIFDAAVDRQDFVYKLKSQCNNIFFFRNTAPLFDPNIKSTWIFLPKVLLLLYHHCHITKTVGSHCVRLRIFFRMTTQKNPSLLTCSCPTWWDWNRFKNSANMNCPVGSRLFGWYEYFFLTKNKQKNVSSDWSNFPCM